MPVLILETVQSVPPVLLVVVPLAVILRLAHTKQSGLRSWVTVRLPVTVAFPLHLNDPTVASPVQVKALIVHAAVVLNASVRYDAVDVNTRGAVHTRPRITVFVASQIA